MGWQVPQNGPNFRPFLMQQTAPNDALKFAKIIPELINIGASLGTKKVGPKFVEHINEKGREIQEKKSLTEISGNMHERCAAKIFQTVPKLGPFLVQTIAPT